MYFEGNRAPEINPYKFGIGDMVKLAHMKETFAKDNDFKWTEEHFFISGRTNEGHIPQYPIKDWNNTPVTGRFYGEELQKIELPDCDKSKYKIEKILKRRTRKGIKEVYVHWEGWAKRFRDWIPASEVDDI